MKILIIKLSALGDVVTASMMLDALKKRYGNVHITWLCGTETLSLVKCFKGIDEVISIDNSGLAGNLFSKISVVLSAWKALFNKKYDLIITAHSDSRYRLLSKSARAKVRRSFGKGRKKMIPCRYHGVEYARLALGEDSFITDRYKFAELNISKSDRAKDMLLLLPGGAKNIMDSASMRRWPLEYYVELAKKLIEKGVKVGLIGGKDDLWTEDAFKNLPVTSFVGQLSIPELLGVFANAKGLVAHDSGPLYMAEQTGVPVLGLFGPLTAKTRLEGISLANSLNYDIPCSPCYDGKYYAKCTNNLCMQNITVEDVMKRLQKMKLI